MRCPVCGADNDRVMDSRPEDNNRSRWRRRKCLTCGALFRTREIYEVEYLDRKAQRRHCPDGKGDCFSCGFDRCRFRH